MILWSKTKTELSEPKSVSLTKLKEGIPVANSNAKRVKNFESLRRRQWAEANPILYESLVNATSLGKKKRVRKAQGVFYRVINWGRFSRFLKHATKEGIIKRLIKFSSVKVPYVASYSSRRKKNRDIKISGPCVACGGEAQVVHHIIMISNGGPNIRRNTVPLCHACHAEVHPWLKDNK